MTLSGRLCAGERMVGTFLSTGDPVFAELAADAVDVVVIDLEHGALGLPEMQTVAIAARAGGAQVMVRLPSGDSEALTGVLDSGVDGVVVPRLDSAYQARRVVERLRYPPRGSRGYGPRRAYRYGRDPEPWRTEAAEPACVVQIETRAGVAAAREIAAVEGVDAVLLGPADLSFDLERPLELHHDEMREAIAAVQAAAAEAEIAFAFAGNAPFGELSRLIDSRCTVLLQGTDLRIYSKAIDQLMAEARSALEQLPASPSDDGVVSA